MTKCRTTHFFSAPRGWYAQHINPSGGATTHPNEGVLTPYPGDPATFQAAGRTPLKCRLEPQRPIFASPPLTLFCRRAMRPWRRTLEGFGCAGPHGARRGAARNATRSPGGAQEKGRRIARQMHCVKVWAGNGGFKGRGGRAWAGGRASRKQASKPADKQAQASEQASKRKQAQKQGEVKG